MTRRPKCVCRSCSGAVAQALAPEHVMPRGPSTIDKPRFMPDKGIRIDRATLGNWSGQPVGDHIRHQLANAYCLFMDETTAPVLDRCPL